MTIGIYSIRHRESGKRYVGKSINVEARLWTHKNSLTKPEYDHNCNRRLWKAVQEYGWEGFDTEILETFDWVDDDYIAERELYWMDHFLTCDQRYGFNLRRDSATKMEVHPETRALMSNNVIGFNNPNFANYWSDEQKRRMSEDAKRRHTEGRYGDDWRRKQSVASTKTWSDHDKRRKMAAKLALAKQKYDYIQCDRNGEFIRRWESVAAIIAANSGFKWQNIYSVCHGHKPTYQGFIWRQELKGTAA